jgi:hypothetical protein
MVSFCFWELQLLIRKSFFDFENSSYGTKEPLLAHIWLPLLKTTKHQ